jgi:uncharacterized membrane protein YtjA (UPF0391 family)
MADSRPHQAELGVAGAPEDRAEDPGAAGSLVRDYATVFKMMSPSYSGEGLTPLQCARLLPLATGVQFFWVVLFMIVELSAGAGGTSGVAGTRTVMLFFVYLLLIPIALLISRAAAAGSLRNSGLVRARESSAVVFVCIPGTGCMLACGYIHAPCTIHTGVRACVRACVHRCLRMLSWQVPCWPRCWGRPCRPSGWKNAAGRQRWVPCSQTSLLRCRLLSCKQILRLGPRPGRARARARRG